MNKYVEKAISDSDFRQRMTTALGGGWNLLYALFHIVMAYFYHSFWFLTMGVYHLTVCVLRASALRLKAEEENNHAGEKAIKRNGILTFVLAIVFSGIVCLTIVEKHNQVYHMYVALAMAMFTFYCVVNAILNLVKLKKNRTIRKILLRNGAMVSAFGSLFGLERMMLGTFGNEDTHFIVLMEALSGAGFFIAILLVGIHLLRLSKKETAEYTNPVVP